MFVSLLKSPLWLGKSQAGRQCVFVCFDPWRKNIRRKQKKSKQKARRRQEEGDLKARQRKQAREYTRRMQQDRR